MEAAPPSYFAATVINHWDIIARYIPSDDLCSAALVCSSWHLTFAPHLWGNPASHFGIENDRVYVALTKFKRTLRTARLLVRSLTHTLHLPPAHAEIYNGPHADWLRETLERLPNLQSLIVRGLPFFDHSALWALKYKAPRPETNDESLNGATELPGSASLGFQRPVDAIPSYGLRLLDASRCPNVTSSSLAQALGRFEGLLYLDLSFTYPARDMMVLQTLRRFTGLQVLKLRGINLVDEHVEILSRAIARRVRSIDLRDNRVSDHGIRTLLDECFIVNDPADVSDASGQRSPGLLPYMGAEMLEIYQGEDFEGFLRNAFTGRFIGRLTIEDAPEGGITHLYVSGNELTVEGVSGLLRSRRLHVLDVDTVNVGLGLTRHLSNGANSKGVEMPGVEKLIPVLIQYAAESLTFLRIEHHVVTKDAPDGHSDQVVQGRAELDDTAFPDLPVEAAEMPAISVRPEVFEMPEVHTPKYELAGDPMQFVVSPAINDERHTPATDEPPLAGPRRGSAFAPEVLEPLTAGMDNIDPLSPVSPLGEHGFSIDELSSPLSPLATPTLSPLASPAPGSGFLRPRTYSSVASERQARLNAHKLSKRNLHPAMLPHVRVLMLTNVPPFSTSKEIANRIIYFIKQCAEESYLARSHARLDYAMPPGRRAHNAALKHSAERVFALNRLVLETAPESSVRRSSKASPWQHNSTRSMTEDRDSEALWSAASTDFSFFGDEDYSFPSLDSGRFAYARGNSHKEVSFNDGSSAQGYMKREDAPVTPKFDTVGLIAAFRKERKLAHERNIAAGAVDPETEGYWDGVVQVVRPGNSLRQDEEIDYYGNRFHNGYLYR